MIMFETMKNESYMTLKVLTIKVHLQIFVPEKSRGEGSLMEQDTIKNVS